MAAQESGVAQPDPPYWAQELLGFLVREDRAENIQGDLLEEYRESVHPNRGHKAANRWYVRQVAGFLWRLSWVFGLAVALLPAIVQAIADTHSSRESFWLLFLLPARGPGIYLLASAYAGWRTQRMVGGALVALTAHVMGSAIAIVMAVVLYFTVIRGDPASLHLFRVTGDWGEVFGMPLAITPIALALGVVGGFIGQFAHYCSNKRSRTPARG
jgi:hypothetical protein